MQLLIFFLSNNSWISWVFTPNPFGLVGSNGLLLFGAMHQVAGPLSRTRPLRDFGGLKWTRTIDLTLIRRVL